MAGIQEKHSEVDRPNANAGASGQQAGDRLDPPIDAAHLTALDGRFIYETGHGGLMLHAIDAQPCDDMEASFEASSALTICICLDGAVDADIGEEPLRLDASKGPVGKLWNLNKREIVRRRSTAWRRERKVVVILKPEWFDAAVLGDAAQSARRIRRRHLAIQDWAPSRRSLRCAEQILESAARRDGLGRVAREALALEITCEALAEVSSGPQSAFEAPSPPAAPALSSRDVVRARDARAFIDEHLSNKLCLGSIARNCGMSVSTLQRVFKSCFGVTVVEHLRRRRLETARRALLSEGISVAEAATLAGYTSAASFATAYQREFGLPPSRTKK